MAGLALHTDGAAVGADDEIDDAEAQTAAAGIAGQAAIYLVESAENFLLVARGDADAVVRDFEDYARVRTVDANGDRACRQACTSRALSIRVEQNGDESLLVGVDGKAVRPAASTSMGQAHAGAHALHPAQRAHQGVRTPGGAFKLLAIALQACEGEEGLDHTAEAQTFASDQFEVFAGLARVGLFVFEEGVDKGAHGGDRCFEFVRDGGDEIGLHAGQLPLTAQYLAGDERCDGQHRDGEEADP